MITGLSLESCFSICEVTLPFEAIATGSPFVLTTFDLLKMIPPGCVYQKAFIVIMVCLVDKDSQASVVIG